MNVWFEKNKADKAEEGKLCDHVVSMASQYIDNNGPEGRMDRDAVFFGVDIKIAVHFDLDGVSVVFLESSAGAKASHWTSREDVEEWVQHRQGYDDFQDWAQRGEGEKMKYYVERASNACMAAPNEYDVKAGRIASPKKMDLSPESGLIGLAFQNPFRAIREKLEIGGEAKKAESSSRARRV